MKIYILIILLFLFLFTIKCSDDINKGIIIKRLPYNITHIKDGISANFTDVFSNIGPTIIKNNIYNKIFNNNLKRNLHIYRNLNENIRSLEQRFIIEFLGNPPDELKKVVITATEIFSELFENIDIPIKLNVVWSSFSDTGILAAAGPKFLYLYQGIYYPDALINQITGINQSPEYEDIIMYVNNNFRGIWNFNNQFDSESGPLSGQYDALTVILHELCHGIGMVGLTSEDGIYTGDGSNIYIYDKYIVNDNLELIINSNSISNPNSLLNLLKNNSNKLYFYLNGISSISLLPKLYSPSQFLSGSSIYHLDEYKYITGSPNSLMTPFINSGERILTLGSLGLSIMESIGWKTRNCTDYSLNCNICTKASCLWNLSNNKCYNPLFINELDLNYLELGECTGGVCNIDEECNNINDICKIGKCSQLNNECYYENIICNDNNNCTRDLCDSDKGCLYIPIINNNDNNLLCENNDICDNRLKTIKEIISETSKVDNNNIQRLIYFPIKYNNWIIKDIKITILFDKISGNNCNITSNSQPNLDTPYPNELYIYIKIPGLDLIKLIDINTFTSKHNNNKGPFKVIFDNNYDTRINALSPKNGTYHPLETIPLENQLVPLILYNNPWVLIFGDNQIGDPSCFYSSEIELLIEPPNYKSPDNILCKGNNDDIYLNELLVNINIPINFFELYSLEYKNIDLIFKPCNNNNKPSIIIKRLSDISLDFNNNNNNNNLITTPIEIVSISMCYNEFIVQYSNNNNNNIWLISLEESIEDHGKENGILTLFKDNNNNINYNIKLSFHYHLKFEYNNNNNLSKERNLKRDNPPGYIPNIVNIDINGIINMDDFYQYNSINFS
jgi:hypothetical protein